MQHLEALLDSAAAALIAGDFEALSRLTPQIESLSLGTPDRKTAEILQAKALRNARLLDAASRGLKSAKQRLSEVTRGPTLTTYDARGQKAQISSLADIPTRRV
jgi:flagellar biosynthesis/type III secretory pathway chaperone